MLEDIHLSTHEKRAHMYESDKHIYITTPAGTKIRAFYIAPETYLVETHSSVSRHARDYVQWDTPIGFIRRDALSKQIMAFSVPLHKEYPTRGVSTAVRAIAQEWDTLYAHVHAPARLTRIS